MRTSNQDSSVRSSEIGDYELREIHAREVFSEDVLKLMANPLNLIVNDHPTWKKPCVGDHVKILSWDTQINVQECVKLSKLPYLTVSKVIPYMVGVDGVIHYWAYQICVEESSLKFLQWYYQVMRV